MKKLLLTALLLASFNVAAECKYVTIYDSQNASSRVHYVCTDTPRVRNTNPAFIRSLSNPGTQFMDSYERGLRIRMMEQSLQR